MTYHEIINTLLFYRKTIIVFSLSVFIFLFLILMLVYPITYSSEVSILPPEENNYGGLSGLLGEADPSMVLGLGGFGGNSQLYAEILKSRSAAELVVDECKLTEYFDEENPQLATGMLQKLLNVEVTKEGIILASVDLSTPLFSRFSDIKDSINFLSARVSNSFVNALDKINREKLNLKARKTREYIEEQISITKSQLDDAEEEYKQFQEEYKTIALPAQLEAAIENAAEIKSEIFITEIKLRTLEQTLHQDNQAIISLKQKLEVLRKEYSQMEAGDKLDKDYLPDFADVPQISIKLARLTRKVKVLNEVYMLLQTQYYREKIQENKNIPTIEVLDKAIPSIRPKSPRLVFHSVLGSLFAFVLIATIVIYQEIRKKELKKSVS